ncbi:MAG TPA: polymer-forming cytoskeletal protein [Clostridiales bacterium]|nr:polymer-forming cytoskeletal protein [Clostridiales bacterium]
MTSRDQWLSIQPQLLKGNIKAKSVQINNGAVIEGFCSLSYAEVDLDNVFEE